MLLERISFWGGLLIVVLSAGLIVIGYSIQDSEKGSNAAYELAACLLFLDFGVFMIWFDTRETRI